MAIESDLGRILHNEDFIKSILERSGSIPGLYEANRPPVDSTLVGSDKEKKMMEILRTRHKNILDMIKLWRTYTIMYEGLHPQEFIHKHLRESSTSLNERKKRGYYLNYVEQIVNIYAGFLFRQPIKRKVQGKDGEINTESSDLHEFNEIIKAINEDIDTNGTSIDDFMKQVSVWNMVLGNQYILVDSPKLDEGATFEDQVDGRLFPFCVRIPPQDIMNWEFDERGRLIWFRYREPLPPITDPLSEDLLDNKTVRKEVYVTWTKDEWMRHEIQLIRQQKKGKNAPVTRVRVKKVGGSEHGLGEVPLVITRAREYSVSKFIGLSFVHDIAFVSIALLNVCSLLDEEMYQKALTLLAVKRSSSAQPEMEIGNNNVVEYTGDQPPFFITPSLTPGQFFLEIISTLSNEIFRMAKLSGGTQALQDAMSGIAHAYLFNETNQALADQADILEKAEQDIFRLITKWLEVEREDVEISVSYPDDFGIIDVERELGTLSNVKDTIPSDTLYETLAMDVAQVLVQGKSQKDLIEKINKEIKEGLEKAKAEEEEALNQEREGQELTMQGQEEDIKLKKKPFPGGPNSPKKAPLPGPKIANNPARSPQKLNKPKKIVVKKSK